MGTINDKLDKLNQTKTNIKNELRRKGATVLDTDTFGSYAGKIHDLEILNGQTKTVNPSTSSQTVLPDSEHNALSQVTVNPVTSSIDNNIQSYNIKSGISILSISGKSSVVDTEDSNAVADDIMHSKTAYVNGSKLTGTLDLDTEIANQTVLITQLENVVQGKAGKRPNWSEIGYADTPQVILDGFNYAKEIQENWDSSVTNIANKYVNNVNLKYFPLVDTSKVTNLYQTFANTLLEEIAQIDISRVTNFTRTFQNTKIKSFPALNTQSATTFMETFQNCNCLVSMPNINSSNSTSVHSMFNRCSLLVTAPSLDTSKVIDAGYFYYNCTKLENVPIYNFKKCTTSNAFYVMFTSCPALTNESLNNIMASLLTATEYAGTKTLAHIGLSSTQATTCQTLSNWTALSNAGWTTGY